VGVKCGLFKEEHKLHIFESRMLRKISRPKRNEVGNLEFYITRNFVIFTSHIALWGWWNQAGYNRLDI